MELFDRMSVQDFRIVSAQEDVKNLKDKLHKYAQEYPKEVENYNNAREILATKSDPLLEYPDDLKELLDEVLDSNYFVMAVFPLLEAEARLYELKHQIRPALQPKN